jgi:hypothetical protein
MDIIPYNVKDIESKIEIIANQLIYCNHLCNAAEIVCGLENGHIPRCLFFEHAGRNSHNIGTIVVGLNPGTAGLKEKEEYISWLEKGQLEYKNIVNRFLNSGYPEGFYYGPVRKILNALNLDGPILWTEVAHCESKLNDKGKKLPLKRLTTSICSRNYLSKEIKSVPNDWIVIGVGKIAYELLLPMFPEHRLVGISHPSFFRKNSKLHKEISSNSSKFIYKLNNLNKGEHLFWH